MASFATVRVREFLEQLAEKAPTPGGGSASALCGGMSAALSSMVIRYTIPKAPPARRTQLRLMLKRSEALRRQLTSLIDRDSHAYERMRQAYKTKRGIQPAVKQAAEVPLVTATASWECLNLARDLMIIGNPRLVSDTAAAAVLAHAAVHGAAGNVLINLGSLTSRALATRLRVRTKRLIRLSQDSTIRLLRHHYGH